jgi:hypothetical protein
MRAETLTRDLFGLLTNSDLVEESSRIAVFAHLSLNGTAFA